MKKIISVLFVFCICLSFIFPCFAAEFKNPPIVDGAGYLTSEQFDELSQRLEDIRQKYNFEVAIYTEVEMSGSSAMASADDIFDYSGYGAGEACDGIILYICSGTRDYWMSTHARGLTVFNDNGIEYMKRKIQPRLKDDNYYGAMKAYANNAEKLLEMAAKGKPYNRKPRDTKKFFEGLFGLIVISLIIANYMLKFKMKKMKTAVENDYAANYVVPGSKHITGSGDYFLYSLVSKTKIPKESSGGSGGSGSHRSSSGRTHGGGGGKF